VNSRERDADEVLLARRLIKKRRTKVFLGKNEGKSGTKHIEGRGKKDRGGGPKQLSTNRRREGRSLENKMKYSPESHASIRPTGQKIQGHPQRRARKQSRPKVTS